MFASVLRSDLNPTAHVSIVRTICHLIQSPELAGGKTSIMRACFGSIEIERIPDISQNKVLLGTSPMSSDLRVPCTSIDGSHRGSISQDAEKGFH